MCRWDWCFTAHAGNPFDNSTDLHLQMYLSSSLPPPHSPASTSSCPQFTNLFSRILSAVVALQWTTSLLAQLTNPGRHSRSFCVFRRHARDVAAVVQKNRDLHSLRCDMRLKLEVTLTAPCRQRSSHVLRAGCVCCACPGGGDVPTRCDVLPTQPRLPWAGVPYPAAPEPHGS